MRLVVDYWEPKIRIYLEHQHSDHGRNIIIVEELDYALQTTLDDEVFLQLWDSGCNICFNFNQKESLIFLERLIDDKCYYTYTGDLDLYETVLSYCDEIYIDIEPDIQKIWDIREQMLYWISYGSIVK
jgi:hypothetical protein